MTFGEYEDRARLAGNYPTEGIGMSYSALALAGEAGELANIVKKAWWAAGKATGVEGTIGELALDGETARRVVDEAGDVLWYLSAVCGACGVTLEEAARANIAKLQDRYGPPAAQASATRKQP
jgi:NTP pyrophosphatase (non-canonical NTP hydrolase)